MFFLSFPLCICAIECHSIANDIVCAGWNIPLRCKVLKILPIVGVIYEWTFSLFFSSPFQTKADKANSFHKSVWGGREGRGQEEGGGLENYLGKVV